MSQYVMMPIKCIGKICNDCHKMDLAVDQYYANGKRSNIIIRCSNLSTCENLYEMIKEEMKNACQD